MIRVGDLTMCEPGDPDLDLDVSGITIAGWTEFDGSFSITLEGGCGWWIDEDGEQVDVQRMEQADVLLTCHGDAPTHLADALSRWSEVKVRLCLAPGRFGWLGTSGEDFLPLPRNEYPA